MQEPLPQGFMIEPYKSHEAYQEIPGSHNADGHGACHAVFPMPRGLWAAKALTRMPQSAYRH